MIVITSKMQKENSEVLNVFLSELLDKVVNFNKCLDKPNKVKVNRLSSVHKIELKWQRKL